MDEDKLPPVVLDPGSGCFKAGFGGDLEPTIIFPSIVGQPSSSENRLRLDKDYYVGDEVWSCSHLLTKRYPIEHGIITNYEHFEKLIEHAFLKLHVQPELHQVMITDLPIGPKAPREKITQILFENFNVPSMYVGLSPVLAMYSTGRTTGVVVETGCGVTRIVPVYEGYWVPHATLRLDLGGRDITEYLQKLLSEKNAKFLTFQYRQVTEDIKEKLCYVPLDYEQEMETLSSNCSYYNSSYTLPDGNVIDVGPARIKAPEIMFTPTLIGKDFDGLALTVHHSILKMDKELRKEAYRNIVLVGGNSLFHGFAERLQQDIKKVAHCNTEVIIDAPKNRRTSGWRGASMLSVMPSFQKMWITKEEYDESGPAIVHRKCF